MYIVIVIWLQKTSIVGIYLRVQRYVPVSSVVAYTVKDEWTLYVPL